jgi:NADH-quinone oxidoreductase subunit L
MSLFYLIPLLPFIGFLINGIGFRKIPNTIAAIIGCISVIIPFIAVAISYLNFNGNAQIIHLFDWISIGKLNIGMDFQIDQLSLLMMLIITGIGSLIHIYSSGYMSHDEGFGKFFAFLNLFIFFMLLLVMGANYVVMFIGWEGVGLCSYLLIGFWNKNENYGDAARKAFIMNRIGDLGFLLGIFYIIAKTGSVAYNEVFMAIPNLEQSSITIIALLLFVGAMGKSAQIPLYTWLPDAMAGPTPVSALIHAATMVTAGIYMIIRSNIIYTLSPMALEIVGWVGLATALFAATIGLFQNDIKKVLAYSTVSQLGYMFMGLGVMAYSSSFFHVMTHAFFKALLFLGAGSVIHAMSNEQDIRKMGGLYKKLPITFWTFLIATIAISGIPPFSGFFSKDEILAHVFDHNKMMWALALIGSFMTSFYMFRLLFLTFFGEFRGSEHQKSHLHESPISMTLPLIILAVLSAIGGFFNYPHIFGGHNALTTYLSPIIQKSVENPPLESSLELTLMAVSVISALLALCLAYYLYMISKKRPVVDGASTGLQKVIYNKYYIDELYNTLFVKPINSLSVFFHNIIEKAGIDKLVEGVGELVKGLSAEARLLQTGATGQYLFAMVISIGLILVYSCYSLLFN